jgi:hypothetical protein
MIVYSSEAAYITDSKTLKDKIARIDRVINALYDSAINAASNNDISSYSLDDGQTSISTSYRSVEEALQAVKGFENLRERMLNKLNGYSIRLLPEENLKYRNRRW